MKKIISLFTTLSIVLSMLGTFTAFAEDSAADLEIGTLAQLEAFRDDVNNGNTYEGKTVKLTADIDMSEKYGEGKESWEPIGWYVYRYTDSHSVPFSGTFDGGGHKIKGFYYYNENENEGLECIGFFGVNNGIIKNVGVTGSITHFYYRGYTGGIAAFSNGIIKNCYFSGTITSPAYVGGIAGENDGQIIDCYNTGTIKGFRYVGGLAGVSEIYTIQNTYNTGNIIKMSAEEAGKDSSDSEYLGSITGNNYDGDDIINNYYLKGTYDIGTFVDESTDPTIALTAEQFADKTNFTNWDFDTVWQMDETLKRPVLRSNTEEPPTPTPTPSPSASPKPNNDFNIKYVDGKAVVTVPKDDTYTIIFASYDNGRLLSVNAQDRELAKGVNEPIEPEQGFNTNGKVRVMLWDSLTNMKPLYKADVN